MFYLVFDSGRKPGRGDTSGTGQEKTTVESPAIEDPAVVSDIGISGASAEPLAGAAAVIVRGGSSAITMQNRIAVYRFRTPRGRRTMEAVASAAGSVPVHEAVHSNIKR